MHTPPHIPNYPTPSSSTIETRTTHTLQTGRGKSLFVCLLFFAFCAPFCQTEIVPESEDICTNHVAQIFLTSGLFQELLGRNAKSLKQIWDSIKFPFSNSKKKNTFYLKKGSSNTNPYARSQFPSHYPKAMAENREMTLVSQGDKSQLYLQGSWEPARYTQQARVLLNTRTLTCPMHWHTLKHPNTNT